jgi:ABC-type branched-subunit amino acid transport system substrate-binding protein
MSKLSKLLILLILLSSCTGDKHVLKPQNIPLPKKEISQIDKIAMIAPLTGANQNLGNALVDSGYLALLQSKKNISIILIDSNSEQKILKQNIQKAIDANIKTFVGPVFSDDTNLVSSMIKDKDVAILSFSNDSSLAGAGVYLMGFLPETYANKVVDYASSKGIYDFYSLLPIGKYGDLIKNSLNIASNKHQISLIEAETYNNRNLSISIQNIIDSIKNNNNKKALLVSDKGNNFKEITDIFSDSYLSTNNIRLINLSSLSDDELVKYQSNNIWFVSNETENSKSLSNIFEKKYQHNIAKLMNLAYDAVTLATTIKSIGDLKNTRGFNGINGFFRFNKDGLIEREVKILEK